MFFLTGSVEKSPVKNRDDTDTRRDTHPLGSVTLTHPGAASALFRCRRDVRHPAFGGGARLQRASTPPAVVRIEHGGPTTLRVAAESRDRTRRSADNFACDAMAIHGSGTVLAISLADTCANVRVCYSPWASVERDYVPDPPSVNALLITSKDNEQRGLLSLKSSWATRRPRNSFVLSFGGGFEFSERRFLSHILPSEMKYFCHILLSKR